uniref:O-methyltransferase n=1 Tax=Ditylenchus dipsaci TaxID=166011 RepID=A0A915CQW8_9BILA
MQTAVSQYCAQMTVKQTPVEKELYESTLENHVNSRPEVLQFGQNFIHLIKAKRCLDIGTFTGSSALAWAVALPPKGQVLSFDVYHSALNKGEAGKWDFAFIDADKKNYTNYYKRAMVLLRAGGVIFVDNALWGNRVAENPAGFDKVTAAVDECNKYMFNDENSYSALLNLGGGTHIAFKK